MKKELNELEGTHQQYSGCTWVDIANARKRFFISFKILEFQIQK